MPYSNIGEVMADLFASEGDAASSLRAQLAAYDINARQVRVDPLPWEGGFKSEVLVQWLEGSIAG